MTPSVTSSATEFLVGRSVEALTGSAGLLLVAILVLLLIGREVLREVGPARLRRWLPVLDIVIVPLLVTFGVIVIVRFLQVG